MGLYGGAKHLEERTVDFDGEIIDEDEADAHDYGEQEELGDTNQIEVKIISGTKDDAAANES